MKCVFNAFADPRDPQYDDYLFTFIDVVRAIAHGTDFKTNIMAEMSSAWIIQEKFMLLMSLGKSIVLIH